MKRKNVLTVMCDYCADGLWWNGGAIDCTYKKLPRSLRRLKKRIEKWQRQYEYVPVCFDLEHKLLYKKPWFKKFVEEGWEIAKEVRKLTPSSIEVHYFNEKDLERYVLHKNGRMSKLKRRPC